MSSNNTLSFDAQNGPNRVNLAQTEQHPSIYAMDYTVDLTHYDGVSVDVIKRQLDMQRRKSLAMGYFYHKAADGDELKSKIFKGLIPCVTAAMALVLVITRVVTGEVSDASIIVAAVGIFLATVLSAIKITYDPEVGQRENERAGDKFKRLADRITQTVDLTVAPLKLAALLSYATRKINQHNKIFKHIDDEVIKKRMAQV